MVEQLRAALLWKESSAAAGQALRPIVGIKQLGMELVVGRGRCRLKRGHRAWVPVRAKSLEKLCRSYRQPVSWWNEEPVKQILSTALSASSVAGSDALAGSQPDSIQLPIRLTGSSASMMPSVVVDE